MTTLFKILFAFTLLASCEKKVSVQKPVDRYEYGGWLSVPEPRCLLGCGMHGRLDGSIPGHCRHECRYYNHQTLPALYEYDPTTPSRYEYGGWLENERNWDSIPVTIPFWVTIGDSHADCAIRNVKESKIKHNDNKTFLSRNSSR